MSNNIEKFVGAIIPDCQKLALAHKAIDVNAEQNYAIQQLYKNDFNIKAAMNNPASVQNALTNLASIGVSLNPALKHAYLVPRDNAICLDVSYMGLMHLAQQEGAIQWGQAKIVYANDTYVNCGMSKEPKHEYQAFGDRGQKVGVYCVAKLSTGDFITEEMSAEQVYKVRDTSKSKDSKYSPWQTFEEEMWRKTVVKRASKYWPKNSKRLDVAIHTLNEFEGVETGLELDISDIEKLGKYASEGHTPLELYAFLKHIRKTHGDDYYTELYKRFPSGLKSSGKQKDREGRKQFDSYCEIFNSRDESAINESFEEMTDMEASIICNATGYKRENAA